MHIKGETDYRWQEYGRLVFGSAEKKHAREEKRNMKPECKTKKQDMDLKAMENRTKHFDARETATAAMLQSPPSGRGDAGMGA